MQKGLAPILVVILIASAVGGYFVSTNYSNKIPIAIGPSPTPTIQAITKPSPLPDTANKLSPTPSSSSGILNDEDYSQGVVPSSMKSLPEDIPIYKNARLWYFSHIRSCTSDEIKNNNPTCDVNSYIYHISDLKLSMDDVLNWYIANPAKPNWIFGTPTFTEARSGYIVKDDIKFIIRITHYGGHKGIQLTFEGPYKN